jgi:hypothetical protein
MYVNQSIVPFKEKHWFLTHPPDGSVQKEETLLKSSNFEPQFHLTKCNSVYVLQFQINPMKEIPFWQKITMFFMVI